jgi:hypothetical protein
VCVAPVGPLASPHPPFENDNSVGQQRAHPLRHGHGQIGALPHAVCQYHMRLGTFVGANQRSFLREGRKIKQFVSAKYYRLAEQNGNKTLGNSWYVPFLHALSHPHTLPFSFRFSSTFSILPLYPPPLYNSYTPPSHACIPSSWLAGYLLGSYADASPLCFLFFIYFFMLLHAQPPLMFILFLLPRARPCLETRPPPHHFLGPCMVRLSGRR